VYVMQTPSMSTDDAAFDRFPRLDCPTPPTYTGRDVIQTRSSSGTYIPYLDYGESYSHFNLAELYYVRLYFRLMASAVRLLYTVCL